MSQNNQNRFAAFSPSGSGGQNKPRSNSKKNKRNNAAADDNDGDEPLLNSKFT